MGNSVLFMPFDPKHQGFMSTQFEYGSFYTDIDGLDKNLTRNAHNHKNSKWTDHDLTKGEKTAVAWFDGKKNAHISSLNTGSIYIRGHGEPGWNIIMGAKAGAESVHWKVVCDRLVQSGLSKSFSGKVKCYNCHSGEAGIPGSGIYIDSGKPFAQELADEMYTRGYKHCAFFGYVGSLDSFQKDHGGIMQKHTYAPDKSDLGRASINRIAFMGKSKPSGPAKMLRKLFKS